MENFKNWVIVHAAEELKIATSAILLGTAMMLIYDRFIDSTLLPNYYAATLYDWDGWVSVLTILAIANVYMLFHVDYYRCHMIGDLLLQLSGFELLMMGWVFFVHYPLANIPMVVYPSWGIGMIVAGKHMGKRSRQRYYDLGKER